MVQKIKHKLVTGTHDLIFRNVHRRRLIYNACWEDPRIDRQLLNFGPESQIVMITSAGCNALDYLLDDPAAIHTVDVNPRQNALLQLKLCLLERGNHEDLFSMFGWGAHPMYRPLYQEVREQLPPYAREFWDDKIGYFSPNNRRKSFYYHGTSGDVAWLLKHYWQANKKLKRSIYALLSAPSLEEQHAIYARIEPRLWNAFFKWLVRQPLMLTMVGVPRPQIQLIAKSYPGGVVGYVRDNLKHVFTEVEMKDNYFWRVYLTGSYTETCCPNYVKTEHFDWLRARTDRIHTHTCTLAQFLQDYPGPYSHFILLDHQDWLAWKDPEALHHEWRLILDNSQPGSKILMRSASMHINFLPDWVQDRLQTFPQKTAPLHQTDRVGTYGSLLMAEVI